MAACKTLWTDLTTKRLYVTGGLGPSARNEGFTADYDLPNETAYAETCAAVGLIFWAHRMLLVEGDARYADMMELALYNGALSGLSLDGQRFFYDNPLASRGGHRRWTWHRCPCCPPNIGRLVASLGQYVYSTGPDEAAVHLYIAGRVRLSVAGVNVALRQETQYPWEGDDRASGRTGADRRIRASPAHSGMVPIRQPVDQRNVGRHRGGDGPRLCAYQAALAKGRRGQAIPGHAGRAYLCAIPRSRTMRAGWRSSAVRSSTASKAPTTTRRMHRIALPRSNPIEAHFESDLLSGVGMLTAQAMVLEPWPEGELYRTDPPAMAPTRLRAIPYSFWSNRDSEEMSVWIREV